MESQLIESPYPGLIPYSEQDARFFFGRGRDQRVIISNLFSSRLTVLYGASGVGKSSVLRAGVIRELHQRMEKALEEGQPPDPAVAYFSSWQGNVLERLKESVLHAIPIQLTEPEALHLDDGASLLSLLQRVYGRFQGDLHLILDQFEEFFLYQGDKQEGEVFAKQLSEVVNQDSLPVSVLISLTDAALSRLDHFKPFISRLYSNYLRLRHLSAEEAWGAIVKPVAEYNRLPASEKKVKEIIEIEPELVEAVLDQVRTGRVLLGDLGRGHVQALTKVGIETPYLQLVMTRLWDQEVASGSSRLRLQTLTNLGGAASIVKNHLNGVMNSFTQEEQRICASMFQFLVTPSGTKIAHPAADLAGFASVPESRLEPILTRLSAPGMRILVPVGPAAGANQENLGNRDLRRYEIYHDSLAQAVLDWRRRFIAEEHREELERKQKAEAEKKQKELEQAQALLTAQQERAEAERRRAEEQALAATRLRRMVFYLLMISSVALGVAVYAWIQRQQAIHNRRLSSAYEARTQAHWRKSESEELALRKQSELRQMEQEAIRLEGLGNKGEAGRIRSQAQQLEKEVISLRKTTEEQKRRAEAAKDQIMQLLGAQQKFAYVTLRSEPQALVFVNDDLVAKVGEDGTTDDLELTPGNYRLKSVKDGFTSENRLVSLGPGKSSLDLKLTRISFSPEFLDSFLEGKKYWSAPDSWRVEKGRMFVNGPGIGFIEGKIYKDFSVDFDMQLRNGLGAVWVLRAEDKQNYYLFQLCGPRARTPNMFRTFLCRNGKLEPLNSFPVLANLSRPGDWFHITIRARESKIDHQIRIFSQAEHEPRNLAHLDDRTFPYGGLGFGTQEGEEFLLGPTTVVPLTASAENQAGPK